MIDVPPVVLGVSLARERLCSQAGKKWGKGLRSLWQGRVLPVLQRRALPVILPFTAVLSTSISTQAFAVFDCHSYVLDSATGESVVYLAQDPRILCHMESREYLRLWRTGIALIIAVSLVPLAYLALLVRSLLALGTATLGLVPLIV